MSEYGPDLLFKIYELEDQVDVLRTAICQFLVGSSLADHLGDVRNSETYLWSALGISSREVSDSWDDDYGLDAIRKLAEKHDLPLPDWATED